MDSLFFISSKFVHYFILPPGVFIVIFIFTFFLIKTDIKYIFLFLAISTYSFSTEFFYDLLFKRTITHKQQYKNYNSFDAVVVLGSGVSSNSPSFKLPAESFKNFMYAAYLSSKHNVPLIFSGKGLSELSETSALKSSLQKISKFCKIQNIYYENESLNTYENANYTKQLLSTIGLENKNIALVTSSWHIERATNAFEQQGLKVVKKPTETVDELTAKKEYNFFSFLPTMIYLSKSHSKIKEVLGKLALKIKGYKT